jgi:hypothetical protein
MYQFTLISIKHRCGRAAAIPRRGKGALKKQTPKIYSERVIAGLKGGTRLEYFKKNESWQQS